MSNNINIKIKTLVVLVISLVTVLLIAIGTLGVYNGNNAAHILRTITVQGTQDQVHLTRIRWLMETNRSQILQALQHNPSTEFAKWHDHPTANHYKIIDETSSELKELWRRYMADIDLPEQRKLAEQWYSDSAGLNIENIANAAAGIKTEDWVAAQEVLIKRINPTYRHGDAAFKALMDSYAKQAGANDIMVNESLAKVTYIMFSVLILGVVLTAAIGILLIRSLYAQLGGEPQHAKKIISRIAAGDLTQIIETRSSDRQSLLFDMKNMQAALVDMVRQIRQGTDTIATASSEIASGNLDLSSRTEQQASSLEETASSMEELTSTVKQNVDNARQANLLAVSAAEVAGKGGMVVSQVVETMGSINDSSKKIVDIISVIDGIAFQTNILALNAAVEAARAGEQGRGFAVVASEVRNLAQRSAAAAKEIKTLIDDSVGKVDAGSKLVGEAGSTMTEIVDSIKRVTDIMSEIMAASQEQSAGIEQVNQAVSQMDQVTQQNASLVEEAAAAAESMHEQAGKLAEVVGAFKFDAGATAVLAQAAGKPVLAGAAHGRASSLTTAIDVKAPQSKRIGNTQPSTGDEWAQF
jgi:methyl-accepting chemotaxis protein